MIRKTFFAAGLLTKLAGAALAESGFLSDYSILTLSPQQSQEGTDLVYLAPDAEERMSEYNAFMVDQPEIHFSGRLEVPRSEAGRRSGDFPRAAHRNIGKTHGGRL